jgi:5'-nucleotidase
MATTRRYTILHSNDMHGDFFAEVAEGRTELIGGLALLSGYVNKVREEEEHVFYVISGDMLQGSLIDSEFKGISTIEIMNYLSPDVVALGNHELDYGLPHLLFLEKMANFPLVNANLFIRKNQRRLMLPFVVIEKAGFEVLFTGILTEKVMDALSQDSLIGSFVDLEEANKTVGRITNAYRKKDIDLTILLTHIGFESDVELARMLDPDWGVDMILGGHSHTVLDAPGEENGVLVAQAGVGTDQIGRFDIVVDDDTNSIVEWTWELVPIQPGVAERDERLVEFIQSYKQVVDDKYGALLTRFSRKLTHPQREVETTLGNALADVLADAAECDVMFLGAGSVRVEEMGPAVTLGDLLACFPYDDSLTRYGVSGDVLQKSFAHVMRNENRDGEGECYQVNRGVAAVYDTDADKLVSLSIAGEPIDPAREYTICLQGYHASNAEAYLAIPPSVLEASGEQKVVATSAQQVLEERLRDSKNLESVIEGRLVYR